jgi:hypothetical protein
MLKDISMNNTVSVVCAAMANNVSFFYSIMIYMHLCNIDGGPLVPVSALGCQPDAGPNPSCHLGFFNVTRSANATALLLVTGMYVKASDFFYLK